MLRKIIASLVAALVALSSFGNVSASPTKKIPVSVEVVPGELSFENKQISIYAEKIILNGKGAIVKATFADTLDIVDTRGLYSGFVVQIDITDLVSENGKITKENVTFRNLNTVSVDGVFGSEDSVSGASSFSLFELGEGKGSGQHTMNFADVEMDVFVAEGVRAGVYSGTLTFSLVTTP